MRNDSATPSTEATMVCTPRTSERCTVACSVSSAVQGARNRNDDSSRVTAIHHATAAATTVLRIWMRSVVYFRPAPEWFAFEYAPALRGSHWLPDVSDPAVRSGKYPSANSALSAACCPVKADSARSSRVARTSRSISSPCAAPYSAEARSRKLRRFDSAVRSVTFLFRRV